VMPPSGLRAYAAGAGIGVRSQSALDRQASSMQRQAGAGGGSGSKRWSEVSDQPGGAHEEHVQAPAAAVAWPALQQHDDDMLAAHNAAAVNALAEGAEQQQPQTSLPAQLRVAAAPLPDIEGLPRRTTSMSESRAPARVHELQAGADGAVGRSMLSSAGSMTGSRHVRLGSTTFTSHTEDSAGLDASTPRAHASIDGCGDVHGEEVVDSTDSEQAPGPAIRSAWSTEAAGAPLHRAHRLAAAQVCWVVWMQGWTAASMTD
jgi:hypothetical protein